MDLTFRWDWSSISHESTQVINCNYLVKLTIILFLTSINYKDCKLQTLTTSRGWSVLFLTSLLMITSGNYFRIAEKKFVIRKHWTKDEVLTAISLESLRFFNWQQELLLRDNILPAFPMLQLLKIVFTFGKECWLLFVNPALLNLQSGAEEINR